MNYYLADQELPAMPLAWSDGNGTLIDFSTGYSFTVKVCPKGATTVAATKTTGITGAATSPNVTIDWSTSDFTTLTAGTVYDVYVYARRTIDSKDRVFNPGSPPTFTLGAAPA